MHGSSGLCSLRCGLTKKSTSQPTPNSRPHNRQGKRCVVSGAGNVAQFCAEMLLEKEAIVLTMSDSQGTIFAEEGLSRQTLKKAGRRGQGVESWLFLPCWLHVAF